MKNRYKMERSLVAWFMIAFMISTNAFTALSQVKQTTYLTNGISCDLEQGMLKVEFVTPDIVRVHIRRKTHGWEMERCLCSAVYL